MELVQIYECLCDPTRLRILNLLQAGPLCVCHLQDILDEPQVKVSKHLGYLKTRGMVGVRSEGNWRVYSLVARQSKTLKSNLACLQDCAGEDKTFRRDLEKLARVQNSIADDGPTCCAKPQPAKTRSA
jgi:ArsR family transcriptional regulator, arsenate/arsenite/antimonite-responsive transcriptional repressor